MNQALGMIKINFGHEKIVVSLIIAGINYFGRLHFFGDIKRSTVRQKGLTLL